MAAPDSVAINATVVDISQKQKGEPHGGAKGTVTKVSRVHPLGTMNVCTKLQGNPSNSC